MVGTRVAQCNTVIKHLASTLDDAAHGSAKGSSLRRSFAPLFTPPRGVFCTRSLDLKDIKCIGYDMDYTLIDYKMEVWEARAYHYSKEELRAKGFPVSGLKFKPELVCRGLIIDTERGSPPWPDRRDPRPHGDALAIRGA